MRDFDIISLDIETSGLDENVHSLLSIGSVRRSDMKSFYVEVRHDLLTVTPQAMQVNGMDIAKINDSTRSSLAEVDLLFCEFLKSSKFYRAHQKYTIIPVGMNVGSFDMQFIKKYLPVSASLFGYRSIDLNALVFEEAIRTDSSFSQIKETAKVIGTSYAHAHVPELGPHHALWDAYSNIGVLEYLVNIKSTQVGEVAWEGGVVNV